MRKAHLQICRCAVLFVYFVRNVEVAKRRNYFLREESFIFANNTPWDLVGVGAGISVFTLLAPGLRQAVLLTAIRVLGNSSTFALSPALRQVVVIMLMRCFSVK